MLDELFSKHPPAAIIARSLQPTPEMLAAVTEHRVPLLSTADTTSSLVAALVAFMNVELAPRITRHGVLVEVYGEGILLVGDSGVGKSETAIELIKRGHRLIADDAVEIRRVSAKSLVGQAPENIRHFIELRGIGIINARRIFGMASVKLTEKIDIVINLEIWDNQKVYDRMGLENEYTEILGIKVPVLTIPREAGAQPRCDHRGCRHEQPPEKDGLQCCDRTSGQPWHGYRHAPGGRQNPEAGSLIRLCFGCMKTIREELYASLG